MNETMIREKMNTITETKTTGEAIPFILPDEVSSADVFPEAEDKKTLYVPKLQSMKNYILFHYKRSILRALGAFLAEEGSNGGEPVGEPPQVTALRPGSADFWRGGKSTLTARLALEADLEAGGRRFASRTYYALLFFDMEKTIRLIEILIGETETVPDADGNPECCPTDEYLIPVMSKKEMEARSEALLYRYNREGWLDQHLNTPEALAEAMGLTVEKLPLHNCPKNKGRLYFKEGKVTVDTCLRDEQGQIITEEREIAAGTILINTNVCDCDDCHLVLYHECVHYEWHCMFYLLQDMYTDDLRELRKTHTLLEDRRSKKADAVAWIEYQAVHGSYAVWMPLQFMENQTRIREDEVRGLHPGARCQALCFSIAKEYGISPFRLRTRLIRLGHIEGRGAMNWLTDHMAEPFSFLHEAGSGRFTYFIRPVQLFRLGRRDAEFRRLMESGEYLYVDGHVCVNDPAILTRNEHGPALTEEARRHIDRYCLRFVEVYERDERYTYRLGRLHYDSDYSRHYLRFPNRADGESSGETGISEQQKRNVTYLNELPRHFPDMLVRLMKDAGVSAEELSRRTGISVRTLTRLRNDPKGGYSPAQVIAIIIGLHLPPWISREVLKAAAVDLTGNPSLYICDYVISCMFMDDYDTVRKYLEKSGLKEFTVGDPYKA